tara:strand:- start:103 stop:471 length:369 start_codon:yes stop_codon:yes gene_type:complete
MKTAVIVLQKGEGLGEELRCELLAIEKGYQVMYTYDFSERDYVDYEYIAEEHGYEDAIIFASKPKFGINIQEHLYFEWRAESTWVVEHAHELPEKDFLSAITENIAALNAKWETTIEQGVEA